MATVVSGNTVKLSNGQTVQANQGGWYDGQQFWGGTLSAPGVINSNSDQIGAGQAVSKEVNAASATAQGVSSSQFESYLSTQRNILANSPSPKMASTGQVQNYTNGIQNGAMGTYVDPSVPKVQTLSEITTELKNVLPTDAPTAPNLLETYKELTSDGTITALEQSIIDLKAQKADALAQLEVNTTAERNKPVAQNVVEGRVSEQQRLAQEKVDFIDRQLTTAADELTMRYKSVEAIMTYTQQDFTNAKSVYDSSFSQAMDLITQARGIRQDEITVQQKAQDNARANLQIFANAIMSGNLSLGSLSPDAAASLNSMELAAGLPMGFISSLQVSAKDQILHINDTTGEVLMTDGNGGFKTVQAMTPKETGGAGGYTAKEYTSKVTSAISIINKVDQTYQTVNGKAVSGQKKDKFGTVIADYTNSGDRQLSRQEMEVARQQIVDSVGGDTELGYKLFNDAMNGGNFKIWGN